uniref:Sema domain-containing protein n=1 Tax=Macrostomum lignano TaxID=282301 RepID=A0A1I8FPM3_9PLAT
TAQLLSEPERQYIFDSVQDAVRIDGRQCLAYRQAALRLDLLCYATASAQQLKAAAAGSAIQYQCGMDCSCSRSGPEQQQLADEAQAHLSSLYRCLAQPDSHNRRVSRVDARFASQPVVCPGAASVLPPCTGSARNRLWTLINSKESCSMARVTVGVDSNGRLVACQTCARRLATWIAWLGALRARMESLIAAKVPVGLDRFWFGTADGHIYELALFADAGRHARRAQRRRRNATRYWGCLADQYCHQLFSLGQVRHRPSTGRHSNQPTWPTPVETKSVAYFLLASTPVHLYEFKGKLAITADGSSAHYAPLFAKALSEAGGPPFKSHPPDLGRSCLKLFAHVSPKGADYTVAWLSGLGCYCGLS